uniref:Glutathione S-transferase n=1 Tax=Cyclina sinensis TaxID=120566 RepID=U3KTS2_CYCSN|nr:glutathione S-transferase [Cyclina sinensis]
MATYKVSYFPWTGNGEIIRLALVAAGKQFEDERLSWDEWVKIKQKTPAKQMPILTVTENAKSTMYGQSAACAKYIAKKYGLFGRTPEEELLIDEVFECVADLQREIAKFSYEEDETKKAELRQKVMEEALPRFNDYFKLRSSTYGKNGYIIGPKMTLADLHTYNLLDQTSGAIEGLLSSYPELTKHTGIMKSDPKIATWIKTRPAP